MSPKTNEKEEARMRNAIALLRVSGDRQDLARQQDEIADVTEEHNLKTERTLELNGVSGTAVLDNEQIQQLLRDLSDPTIDGIVVSALDRLFRPKEFGQMRILDFFAKNHKLIWTARDGELDPSTDSGWELCMVLATRAGAEIRELRRRSMRGKLKNAKKGGCNSGSTPYGYRQEHRENSEGKRRTYLTVFEPEAETIRKMFLWAAGGLSINAIARKLNLEGIPAQRAGQINPRTGLPNSGKWDRRTVYQILTNRTYSGVTEYPRHSPNPVLSPNPAIIDESLWGTVQLSLRQGEIKRGGRPPCVREYRLTGLMWCQLCGHRITTSPRHRGKGGCYRCSYIDSKPPAKRLCRLRHFEQRRLEAVVCDSVWGAWSNPAALIPMIEEGYATIDAPAAAGQIQKAEAELARLQAMEDRALENWNDPEYPRDKGKALYQQCQRDRRDAELVLRQLKKESEMQVRPSRKQIEKLARDIAANPPETYLEWRTFLRLVVKKILLSDTEVHIETMLPSASGIKGGETPGNNLLCGIDSKEGYSLPFYSPLANRPISFPINIKLAD